MRTPIAERRADLEAYINELYEEFLRDFFPAKPEQSPEQFHHRVKAYCVLAHAAFEEFVEVISLEIMENALEVWINERRATDALISMSMFYKIGIEAIEEEGEPQDRVFNLVRKALENAKSMHSNAIHENHGFSLKYLRRALTPIFLDVPTDEAILGSLRTLSDARGSYAHSVAKSAVFVDQKRARKPMTPDKAKELVSDCLKLCLKIADGAEKYLPPLAAELTHS